MCLLVAAVAACVATAAPSRLWPLASIGLIGAYILLTFGGTAVSARGMLAAAMLVTGLYILSGGSMDAFVLMARQAVYLPALITVLVPLRIVARDSEMVREAGRFIVDQPPNRRYGLLAIGGQVFGVLLNIGGLMLLLDVALRGPISRRGEGPAAETQVRGITTAVLRGFCANLFWSPVGLGLNLMLTLTPGLTWFDFAPYGLAATLIFLAIGWLFDRAADRPPPRPSRTFGGGGAGDLAGLLCILAGIIGAAALLQCVTGMPLRGTILVVIPLVAAGWHLTAHGPVGERSARRSLQGLGGLTFQALPSAVNEIAIIASAGYLGLMIGAMVPEQAVRGFVLLLGLEGALLACSISLLILLTSLLGLNPIISSTIIVKATVSAGLVIPEPMLILSALIGWGLGLLVSPATSTLSIACSATGQPPFTVGLRWNGFFCLSVLMVAAIGFLTLSRWQ
ncbi:hypothetical protein [Ancylobacter amanitiformis]|uniref:Citrate transporter-like domain-containing protein n=1 Tax=Ancylobacter amanitiformis TaxID=217069 RepID=A0ABU0LWB8_9HYPH|nr:hypothetical protein [Ancylobacter amanitiformis]MDQ0512893.1 hypothetical protein [Ancylobacter amanitiformis]